MNDDMVSRAVGVLARGARSLWRKIAHMADGAIVEGNTAKELWALDEVKHGEVVSRERGHSFPTRSSCCITGSANLNWIRNYCR